MAKKRLTKKAIKELQVKICGECDHSKEGYCYEFKSWTNHVTGCKKRNELKGERGQDCFGSTTGRLY